MKIFKTREASGPNTAMENLSFYSKEVILMTVMLVRKLPDLDCIHTWGFSGYPCRYSNFNISLLGWKSHHTCLSLRKLKNTVYVHGRPIQFSARRMKMEALRMCSVAIGGGNGWERRIWDLSTKGNANMKKIYCLGGLAKVSPSLCALSFASEQKAYYIFWHVKCYYKTGSNRFSTTKCYFK